MLRVGLTGNIASGKSAVAAVWRDLGAHVIDADRLARQAVAPGSPGLDRVVAAFGGGVLAPDGSLDRATLRRLVFEDPAERRVLEAIVHPEVQRLRMRAEEALAARGATIVVHEIPLLFETGLQDEFDVIVLVDAPETVRLQRMVDDRDVPAADARAMIEAQVPAATKRAAADVVIENDADPGTLETRATEVWRALEARVR